MATTLPALNALNKLQTVTVTFNPGAGTMAAVMNGEFGGFAETRDTTAASYSNEIRIPIAVEFAKAITGSANGGVPFPVVGYEIVGFHTFRIVFRIPKRRRAAK
jgi:hypothetical protein